VKGEGMPMMAQPSQRGDLIIRFEIEFPKTLPPEIKPQLAQLLPE